MAIRYKVMKAPQHEAAVEDFLNDIGDENWELIIYTKPGGLAIFKKSGSAETKEDKP